MKKLVALMLSAAILISFSVPVSASTMPADDEIEAILDIMEIMTFDAKGNFNENQFVTRASLAKMLVSASQYRGSVASTSRISPFADVMHTHWGAPYISVAAKNKFMTGYSDGTFRPDNYVLYEEALSAILRLMGYTSADYTGAYPAGQITKADDIGLTDEVNAKVGSPLKRSEMAKIIYNMLNTPAKGATSIYATTLGYTRSSEMLTIEDVLDENTTGPVTVNSSTLSSINLNSPKVYRNGVSVSLSDIELYDIIYYSAEGNSIWAYSQKVSGTLNSIAPNKQTPTSVTVSGVTYPLNYRTAQRAFGLDGLETGKNVTLLLDKNGNVYDAYNTEALYSVILGTGPITVNANTLSSINLNSPKVYRNGSSASLSDIEFYDIIYYSREENSIWAYSQKISGVLTAISPNKQAPTSVTVSGVTYPLEHYVAQNAFGLDGLEVGNNITMLLGKNGEICDAYETEDLYKQILGVVTEVSAKTITAADGTKETNYYSTILMLDGSTVDVQRADDSTSLVGHAVTVNLSAGTMNSISNGSGNSSAYVNATSYLWGNTPIARNVKILEIDDNGNTISLSLDRLDGVKLTTSSVLLSSKNSSGEIDGMILKNVTGDMHKYGLITSVDRSSVADGLGNSSPSNYIYHYDLGGLKGTVSFNGVTTELSEGPCVFIYDDGELDEAKNLTRATNVTLVTPSYVTVGGNVNHRISTAVQVYKIVDDTKIATTIEEAVSHNGTVWIYYDKVQSEGGLVRVIYLK